MNTALEGKGYPVVAFEVSEARVRAFREIFGEHHGIPPTFATAAEFSVLPGIIEDPELGLDLTRVIHATQEYEYRRPLVLGETLDVAARLASVRLRGGNGFLTVETELRGSDGEIAAVARSMLIEREVAP